MRQQTARINVTLPKELIESVNQIAGPRSRSRLIAESLREHIRQMKKVELEKQLEEGYRAAAKESIALAREFEAVDLEGWDEY
jgi:CopG family transcriptional regulator / antitoxin EndoAI